MFSKNRPNKRVLKRRVHNLKNRLFNNSYFRFAAIGLGVFAGLLYVVQINVTATKGYEIRELEDQIERLGKEKTEMELAAIELQSMDRMIAQMPQYRLVEARPDGYLTTATTTFASR